MKPERQKFVIFSLLLLIWIFLVAWVSPVIQYGDDTLGYLKGAQCFFESGMQCAYTREPFFPVFLSLLMKLGLKPENCLPLIQNIFFGGVLFLFASALSKKGEDKPWLWAALLTLLTPTFWIAMNGAIYVEAFITTLICLEFFLIFKILKSETPSFKNWNLGFFLALWIVASCLSLCKGSLIFIQILFALFTVFICFALKSITNSVQRRRLFASLFVIVTASVSSQSIWFHVRPKLKGLDGYERAGTVLYGRTEYAKKFDFKQDTLLYLLNSFSESACRAKYGIECHRVSFEAENVIGTDALTVPGTTDAQLFRLGKQNLLNHFPIEVLFATFEWTRFIFYHSTTGFARLTLPGVKDVLHSKSFNGLLKILSVLTWFVALNGILSLIRSKKASIPATLILLFCIAYLAVYGFATTVVRMVYPIAVFVTYYFWFWVVSRWLTRQKALKTT